MSLKVCWTTKGRRDKFTHDDVSVIAAVDFVATHPANGDIVSIESVDTVLPTDILKDRKEFRNVTDHPVVKITVAGTFQLPGQRQIEKN